MTDWPKLPRKVEGAICTLAVKLREPQDMTEFTDFGDISTHTRKPELNINKTAPVHWQWQTFFHEIIHLLEEEAGVELRDKDGDSEVDRLAFAMLTLWRRNGWALPGE